MKPRRLVKSNQSQPGLEYKPSLAPPGNTNREWPSWIHFSQLNLEQSNTPWLSSRSLKPGTRKQLEAATSTRDVSAGNSSEKQEASEQILSDPENGTIPTNLKEQNTGSRKWEAKVTHYEFLRQHYTDPSCLHYYILRICLLLTYREDANQQCTACQYQPSSPVHTESTFSDKWQSTHIYHALSEQSRCIASHWTPRDRYKMASSTAMPWKWELRVEIEATRWVKRYTSELSPTQHIGIKRYRDGQRFKTAHMEDVLRS